MEFTIKHFNELTTLELYKILQLRCDVFVVEQDCPYSDLDNKDLDAWHLVGYDNDKVACYCRILKPGVSYINASIGRVIVAPEYRKEHLGESMIKCALDYIDTNLVTDKVEISAQAHLVHFYGKNGFKPEGEIYLEDNIEHIHMIRD